MKNTVKNAAVKTALVVIFVFAAVSAMAAEGPATKSDVRTLEQRIQMLEEQQHDFDKWYNEYYVQAKGRVSPFLGESVSFGGFFENAITHIEGPDTQNQTSANANALGFNVAANFTDKIRFASQFITTLNYPLVNPQNNPALPIPTRQFSGYSLATLVAQAYIEYAQNEAFVVQTGLGYVPFGHGMQLREPVLFLRRGGAMMINSLDIAFPLWMGVHLSGRFNAAASQFGYDAYTLSPSSNPKTLGVGGRLWWNNLDGITAGVSYQYAEPILYSYDAYGADLDVKINRGGFVAEYGRQVTSGGNGANESYYIEPYYNLSDAWVAWVTADYLDDRTYRSTAGLDPFKKWITGLGVNWLPIPNARFRLGFLNHQYVGGTDIIAGQNRNYTSVDFSTGIAF